MGVTMSGTTKQTIPNPQISISWLDLENLLRRVVREVVREELSQVPRSSERLLLDDWSHEGPDDPAGDAALLSEAVAVLDEYGDKPETWMTWEDFEAELDRAEARGELPG